MEDRELVALLYRADWTGLTLSGSVRGAEPDVDTTFITTGWGPPGPWWPRGAGSWRPWRGGPFPEPPSPPSPPPPWFEPHDAPRTLVIAPGRRFRVQSADGSWVLGSDGERVWQWLRDPPPDTEVQFDAKPRAPFRNLLIPSWLLSGYSLAQSGSAEVFGRSAVRVLATPRRVLEPDPRLRRVERGSIGLVPVPGPRWLRAERWDEVDAVIDAELGILLRCSRRRGDHAPSVIEFESLEVGGPVEHSVFSAPAGSVFGRSGGGRARRPREHSGGWATGESFGDALDSALSSGVREAAKTVAGLAAGGLGAVIKYGPSRTADPFAQATAEEADPDAAMPTDEPDPDAPPGPDAAPGPGGGAGSGAPAGAVSDEVLHLLYRGGLPAPEFTATLHEWFAVDALLDAVPPAAREAGFGGVGFLVDTVRAGAEDQGVGDLHSASSIRMGGWTRYRIDVTRTVTIPERAWRRHGGRARASEPLTVASDGVQRWSVYADRAVRSPAGRAPDELADLVDASWLLELDLSGGDEVAVDGRRGYRVVARSREARWPLLEWWGRLFFPAVAVIDAETGRLLRLTRFKGGRPVLRQELRDVGPLPADADFAFTPPPGMPVVDPDEDSADSDSADSDSDSESSPDEWSWSADEETAEEPGKEEAVRDPARETADAIRKQVDETVAAARDFLGSFFGSGRRED